MKVESVEYKLDSKVGGGRRSWHRQPMANEMTLYRWHLVQQVLPYSSPSEFSLTCIVIVLYAGSLVRNAALQRTSMRPAGVF
jgi:hypothetical protein